MGPLQPARGGGRKKGRGGRGVGPSGVGQKAGGQPTTGGKKPQSAIGGDQRGKTSAPAKGGKGAAKAGKRGAAQPATNDLKEGASASTTPKRNNKPKRKPAQKFVAVNRNLSSPNSAFDGASPTTAEQGDSAHYYGPSSSEDGPSLIDNSALIEEGGSLSSYASDSAGVGIAHTLFPTVSDDFKSQMLLEMLQAAVDPTQSFIVFARTTPTVVALAEALDKISMGTVALKEDDPVELLTVYTDEFRMGKYRVLLLPEECEAHTILSGLEHVTHAIYYDVPDIERYMARVSALRAEGDELIPLDVFTFITPFDEEAVLALEDVFGPMRRHIGSVSSSLQPQDEAPHSHPTYQQHINARDYLHSQQKAQRVAQQSRQRRQEKGKHNSPAKQQTKPAKTKHLKQPSKTPKEVKGFLSNASRFNTGAAESWRSSPGARTSVAGGWRA